MRSKEQTIEGTTYRWVEHGQGVPLVLIHGIPTSPALWRHVIPKIEDARCLAFEMLGYGNSMSEGKGRDISVAHQADYIAIWLNGLGIKHAVFAGHDLGGGVVQNIAIRYPALCTGIFLANSICYDSWPLPALLTMERLLPLVRPLPRLIAKQAVRTLMYRGHDSFRQARKSLRVHWRPYACGEGAQALIRQVKSLAVQDTLCLAEDLRKITVPSRVLWGAADPIQKIGFGERLAQDLNVPLRQIDGGKHFTPEDHPDIVAEEINQLLREVEQAWPHLHRQSNLDAVQAGGRHGNMLH